MLRINQYGVSYIDVCNTINSIRLFTHCLINHISNYIGHCYVHNNMEQLPPTIDLITIISIHLIPISLLAYEI